MGSISWPLHGRADELATIESALDRSGISGVLLVGAAGVGKTRIAREAWRQARRRGRPTHWVAASTSSREIPWGAFASILPEIADPTRMLQRAIETLGRAEHPVLCVDDVHLLDPMSIALLHELVAQRQVSVVATLRDGEDVPATLSSMWTDGDFERIEVQSLPADDVQRLLEEVLAAHVDPASADRLWAFTEGNPLFLHELVTGELSSRRLVDEFGVWRWVKEGDALPRRLVDVIQERIGAASSSVAECLDVLALAEPLDLRTLSLLVDRQVLDDAEQRGLIRLRPGGEQVEARLSHPLYGEVRRLALGELRARRVRGEIATAMAATGSHSTEELLKRALLTLDSDLLPDRELCVATSRLALGWRDLELAERLSRVAVGAGPGFDARIILAYALTWLTKGVEAEAELTILLEEARNHEERLEASIVRAGNLFWTLEDTPAALELSDRLLDEFGTTPAASTVEALRAIILASLGDAAEAAPLSARALADAGIPPLPALFASWASALSNGVLGNTELAVDAGLAGRAVADRFPELRAVQFGLGQAEVLALRLAGRVDAVGAATDPLLATRWGGVEIALSFTMSGQAALARSRLGDAVGDLRAALLRLPPTTANGWRFQALLNLALATAQLGRASEARDVMTELDENRHAAFEVFFPDVELARAWTFAAEGAVTEATDVVRQAAATTFARGALAYEVLIRQTAVQFGDAGGADRLAELSGLVEGPRAAVAAAHSTALLASDTESLLRASAGYEEIGDPLAAADAAAQASAILDRRGEQRAARAAAAGAAVLAKRCQGAKTPALAAGLMPLPLTAREREIATLAARGLSNREIADRLVLSERTVEGHLYRASSKLGVERRAQLAGVILE